MRYSYPFLLPGTVIACLFGFMLSSGVAQDPVPNERIQMIEQRLDRIDSRLTRIENVLFASIRYSEAEARRQLKQAKESLAQSERLHAQGLVSASQLELDRMSLHRAETLLKMCVQNEDHRKIGAQLGILDAKQKYERLLLNLRRTQQLYEKGFAAGDQIAKDKAAIVLAAQKLKLAENKLKELNASMKVDNAQPPKK